MVRTVAVLALIAGAFGAGAYVFQRPTVARGDVMAGDLLAQGGERWKAMSCDADIAIDAHGAQFECELECADGNLARLAMVIDTKGGYHTTVMHESLPVHPHTAASYDPCE